MPSVILNDTILKGELTQNDSITLGGTFVGNISAEEIIINDRGNINGNLNASINIEINGEVVGDLISDRIHLSNGAKVRGKLFHKNLVVEEGAQVEISASSRKKLSNLNIE